MCVYNTQLEYLVTAVKSILTQNYTNIELIIVDDCSSDDLFKDSVFRDQRIVILRNEKNMGPSFSRNRGILASSGEYVAFMDSDDISTVDRLETQLSFLLDNADYVACSSWYKEFHIQQLFDSLLRQTAHNFIHYIYEDGSSEPLDEMIIEYKKQVSKLNDSYRVVYEKNENNIGLNLSTKHCIEHCCCDYFIWIDCDNWVDERFFEELESCVIQHPDNILFATNRIDVREGINKYYFSRRAIKRAKQKNRSVEFLCTGYHYSFFAVNTQRYRMINPNNVIFENRSFFNDVQIISHCIFSSIDFSFAENAYSYVLIRENSEGNRVHSKIDRLNQKYDAILAVAKLDNWNHFKAINLVRQFKLMEYEIDTTYSKNGYKECKNKIIEMIAIIKSPDLPKPYAFYLKKSLTKWKRDHRFRTIYKTLLTIKKIKQKLFNLRK